jgi:hypothetical protein
MERVVIMHEMVHEVKREKMVGFLFKLDFLVQYNGERRFFSEMEWSYFQRYN